MREIWVTPRGDSDKAMEVMEQRGRRLLDMAKICLKFLQCGQGSVGSEYTNVCTPVELQCAHAKGSFQAMTGESP